MKDILQKINKSRTLGVAAFLISLSYLLSRVLGLVRDRMLAANFGVSANTDAYTAAFRIPDLLFTLLVSGAFAVAFIPVFVGYMEKRQNREAWHMVNALTTLLVLVTVGLGVVAFIFADPMVKVLAPGFDLSRHTLTVTLTRIMLVTPLMFALASVFGAIQQSFNRFALFAFASIFYNVGIIIGIVFFAKLFPANPIYGVAWGVVAGTALQAIVQLLGTIGLGFRFRFSFDFLDKSVVRVVKLMIPRSLDLGIDQINWIIQTAIASRLSVGSLASYYYANNLKNVPVALFGAAISTAAFPGLIRAAKSTNKARLPEVLVRDMGYILFLTIPSAAIAMVMRGYIVRLLFGFGDQATADTLGWLGGVIIAQSLYFMVARVFYAFEDTKTPLFTSLSSIVINIVLSFILSAKYGISGMAMALSISSLYELILLVIILQLRIKHFGLRSILIKLGKVTVASGAMAAVLYYMVSRVFPLYKDDVGITHIAPKFLVLSIVGVAVYFAVAKLLRLDEVSKVIKKALHPLKRIRSLYGSHS